MARKRDTQLVGGRRYGVELFAGQPRVDLQEIVSCGVLLADHRRAGFGTGNAVAVQ